MRVLENGRLKSQVNGSHSLLREIQVNLELEFLEKVAKFRDAIIMCYILLFLS
jgi:hypothetical protein